MLWGDAMTWIERLQSLTKSFECFGPNDPQNPAPGHYVVRGPTGEFRMSNVSIDDAAFRYLREVMRDHEACDAEPRSLY